ncbi:DUF4382 domain-containing protein [Ramlibacter sp. PS4R-6]|uniref:DUF4382 domain-containing protein n=1 Tax=Ramlibacter sp. PS4R-6 TaxID=3133438 RepID=UPI0030AFDAAF
MASGKLQWIGLGVWSSVVAAAMVACGGGGGSPSNAEATMRFAITDAPACGYDHVWVTVEKVRVHTSGSAADADAGWTELAVTPARRVDLLTLTNGVLEELGSTPLAPGHYSQVRLVLAANTAGAATPANAVQPTGGAVVPLSTPSGQQSGLKLQANVDVAAGQMADLVLDFDACRSVVKAGNSGQYNLKPVVSVVPRIGSAIQGSLATSLVPAATTISAQQNGVTVRSTAPDAAGNFSLPFLQAGTYTLVITSDAHATGVIANVPAGSTNTVLSTTPITLPTSAMANVSGTVTATSGTPATTSPVTDATLRATQSLTGGPVIEVARQNADATTGGYVLRLPMAAPVKATFGGTTLTFAADAAVAGKYSIESTAPGRATVVKPADVSTSGAVTVDFAY